MAKLTEEQLDEGRALAASGDLENFNKWLSKNKVHVNREVVAAYINKGRLNNRMFNAVFANRDFTKERYMDAAVGIAVIVVGLALVLGILGGIKYLFWG